MKKLINFKEIAIVAPTASGKTQLSLSLAHKLNAVILSLDSLAVYKQIDIASAKPSLIEREGIVHFGIDCVLPCENFDVIEFYDEYKKAKQFALDANKNLLIVGGTGFYLKALIEGLSQTPKFSTETLEYIHKEMKDLHGLYKKLLAVDPLYMKNISQNDSYRIEKAAQIYFGTQQIPTDFFAQNKPQALIKNLPIYEIETDPFILRERIQKRTSLMLKNGLIDEVIFLEKHYNRSFACMNSIGISETFDYLDSKITKKELENLISIHTAQLAKRQRTFNRSQFKNIRKAPLERIENNILNDYKILLNSEY